MEKIQFIDLAAQQKRIGAEVISEKINAVLAHGQYIMGPEVKEFEQNLGDFGGTEHCLSCSNGSDAIFLALLALGIGPGDAVFVPSFTFAATAEMVALAGATPVFVDVLEDTFNMDPAHLKLAIEEVKAKGELTAKAVMPVCLFGQIADYPSLAGIAKAADLAVIADAAQGFGAALNGKQAGHWADLVTTSFFPAKPLGGYGDGGAVLTNNQELMDNLVSLRNHGQGTDRYDNVRVGINGRLDSIQAAILNLKLEIFADEIKARGEIAARYNQGLGDLVTTPALIENSVSTWAQYTIRHPKRDEITAYLRDQNIPTAIYYARPIHRQTAYESYPIAGGELPVTEALSKDVFSLPMHPYLKTETQEKIITAIRRAIEETA